MPRVVVVIPTWNGLAHLRQCLPALMAQEGIAFAVVVVDNGSSDGTTDFLHQHYPGVQVLRFAHNLGFAAANNAAMRKGNTEFVVTLNNDTLPQRGWLESLVAAADAYPEYGAFASKMCFWQQPHVVNSAGIQVDRAGLAWDRNCGAPVGEAYAEAEVFGASAGAALYRREMLDDIGLFDERFFAYLEDVDLAWRAQWAGWRARYVPKAEVLHAYSGTSKEGSAFKLRHLGRNKVWLLAKNYPRPALLRYLPAILFFDLAGMPLTIVGARTAAPLAGRIAALTHMSKVLGDRRQHESLRRISPAQMLDRLDPVPHPLTVLRRQQRLKNITQATTSME